MHDVAGGFARAVVRSKDAQKQLPRTSLSLARYLTNPLVIAWLPALKGPLEPRLLTEILLFWASLRWLNRVMQDHEARASDLNRKLIFSFFLLFS